MGHRSLSLAAALATVIAIPTGAEAALVQLCGPSVCYEYDDDPVNNPGVSFFSAPSLLGNSDVLEFTPPSFEAMAIGPGSDIEAATFTFTRVWAQPGFEIASLKVAASGDYQIIGGGQVQAVLALGATDLVNETGYGGFAENIGDVVDFVTNDVTGFAFENWSLVNEITPASLFVDLATELSLTIGTSLVAQGYSSGQFAYILSKLTLSGITTIPVQAVVPVPAAGWLLGSALFAVAGLRRRRED